MSEGDVIEVVQEQRGGSLFLNFNQQFFKNWWTWCI